jgi:sulfur-oxidizing protein SoxZ
MTEQTDHPIRIRTKMKNDVTEVHVLIPHPMETGMRKDDAGRVVPAHYISDVRISVAGRPVLAARMGIAVSQDPLLYFRVKDVRRGDLLRVAWTDNLGDQRVDEIPVS